MKRVAVTFAALVALAGISWFFPLFHVVPLRQVAEQRQQETFNATNFVQEFWSERLMTSLDKAADAATVLAALKRDSKQAREKFGRSVGLSDSVHFFLRGHGKIVSVSGKGVGVSLQDSSGDADVLLPTGLLFGNTVRDATGLLDASAYPNSQDFNDISSELNRIIETQIFPPLKERAAVGKQIEFVGCAEISEDEGDWKPLKIIPVSVKIE